jgi:hypothetical protein
MLTANVENHPFPKWNADKTQADREWVNLSAEILDDRYRIL